MCELVGYEYRPIDILVVGGTGRLIVLTAALAPSLPCPRGIVSPQISLHPEVRREVGGRVGSMESIRWIESRLRAESRAGSRAGSRARSSVCIS